MGFKNLSESADNNIISAKDYQFGIVVSEWNEQVTHALLAGVEKTLLKFKAKSDNLYRIFVPGSFELVHGAQLLLEMNRFNAIICLGCLIQGETPHFDYICQAVAKGIMDLNIAYKKPVIFGVLTAHTMQQAIERAGGIHGNKGDEAAVTAIKMAHLSENKINKK